MEISLRECPEKTSTDCSIFILCKDTIKLMFLNIGGFRGGAEGAAATLFFLYFQNVLRYL